MNLDRRTALLVSLGIVAAMLVLSAWAWVEVDAEQVPVHWGFSGEPDRYGSKLEGLLLLPLVTLGLIALLAVLPRIEPRRENLERSESAYALVWLSTTVFLGLLHVAMVVAATGRSVDMSTVVGVGIGLMFVAMGFALTRVKSNYVFGMRTPWTLSSERSWERTHVVAARLFVGVGLASMAAAVVSVLGGPRWLPIVTILAGAVGSGLAAAVYSYVVWREDPVRVSR